MVLLPAPTLEFFETYKGEVDHYEAAAEEARVAIKRLLEGNVQGIRSVEARAKDPYSLLEKLRRKGYAKPEEEVTDLIGVRVITQYPDGAERAAEVLQPGLEVDPERSEDKLDLLDANKFGYRSIHLLCRLHEGDADLTAALGRSWFEVQIRSLLQHAWAEVDHDVKYKSGVEFPKPLKRRLAAIAGALETLDLAFVDMRETRQFLVARYRQAYEANEGEDVELDSARLIACLEVARPEAPNLSNANAVIPGPGHVEKIVNEALATVGITTAQLLFDALASEEEQKLLQEHASKIGVAPSELSHLVVCVVVLRCANAEALEKQFPELLFDEELGETLGIKAT